MAYAEDYRMIGMGYYSSNKYPSVERTPSGSNRMLDFETFEKDETDIDFINGLYRGENHNYFLGSWIIKTISDITLHYMGIPSPDVVDNEELKSRLTKTYLQNKSKIYNMLKMLGLYGQSYIEIGYNQKKKQIVFFPHTKKELIDVRYENYEDPDDITYARIRTSVPKYDEKREDLIDDIDTLVSEVINFDKIYWKENNSDYIDYLNGEYDGDDVPSEFIYYVKVLKIDGADKKEIINKRVNPWGCIPVVEFNQNRLDGDKNGYSDANGIVKLAGVYHQILESAIDANMYNGKPTIVFTGLDDAKSFVDEMYGELGQSGTYTQGVYDTMGGYYLTGDANVRYLQVNDTVSNAKALLELLFYIFIQVSSVPEWAMGASVNNTYASTKMQSTPLIQKINSKRLDVNDSFLDLNEKVALIIDANDEEFTYNNEVTSITWDEVLPDDSISLEAKLNMAKNAGLITDETYLRLLKLVTDEKVEIKNAKEELVKKVNENKIITNPNPDLSNLITSDEGNDEDTIELGEMDMDAFIDIVKAVLTN